MRGGPFAAVAVTVALGVAGVACHYGRAPMCTSDADCERGRHCVVSAGICVGFETPLLPAPDGGLDGAPGDGPVATDGPPVADAAGDAPTDAPGGGG